MFRPLLAVVQNQEPFLDKFSQRLYPLVRRDASYVPAGPKVWPAGPHLGRPHSEVTMTRRRTAMSLAALAAQTLHALLSVDGAGQ